jgi:hypothetical protein
LFFYGEKGGGLVAHSNKIPAKIRFVKLLYKNPISTVMEIMNYAVFFLSV